MYCDAAETKGAIGAFPRNDRTAVDLVLMAETINILGKPIERIRETCEMMGAAEKLEQSS